MSSGPWIQRDARHRKNVSLTLSDDERAMLRRIAAVLETSESRAVAALIRVAHRSRSVEGEVMEEVRRAKSALLAPTGDGSGA